MRALLVTEDANETRIATGDDAEAREFRELRSRARVGSYVGAAIEQRSVDGAELELNQALLVPSNRFPLSLLAPAEERAETNADGRANQSSWIDRLFAETMAMYLGDHVSERGTGCQLAPRHYGGFDRSAAGTHGSGFGCLVDRGHHRAEAEAQLCHHDLFGRRCLPAPRP